MQISDWEDSISSIISGSAHPIDTELLVTLAINIEKDWLTEILMKQIHSIILSEYPIMAWVYRTLPITVWDLNLPLAYRVPTLMRELFKQSDLTTLRGIVTWFISVLEEIHPFLDGNRRTCFICLEAQLRHIGIPIVWLGNKRHIWEYIHYTHSKREREDRISLLIELIEQVKLSSLSETKS
jgi:fido (protein-threonine AMPylation protein)